MRLFQIIALLALFISSFTSLATSLARADEEVTYSNWHFNALQLGAVGSIQQGGVRMGALGRYLPDFQFDRHAEDHFWSIGADLGMTIFTKSDEPAFVVGEYGFYGAYHLNYTWDIRVVAGAQSWSDYNGTDPFVGPDVIYHIRSEPKYFGIDGFFVSYKAVFHHKLANFMSGGINFAF